MQNPIAFAGYLNTIQAAAADLDTTTVTGQAIINTLPSFPLGTQFGCSFIPAATGTAGIWTVNPATVVSSTYYVVAVGYYNTVMNQQQTDYFTYYSTSATDANFQSTFNTWATNLLSQFGYVIANGASDSVTITAPKNQFLYLAQDTRYGSGSTLSVTNSTPAVQRIGYGQDILNTYAWPTATSSSSNDGIYPTNSYYQVIIPITPPQDGGFSQYQMALYLNTADADYTDLVTALKAALV